MMIRFFAALTIGLVILASNASAQYPTKTVRILVPYSPGAAPDLIARMVAEGLTEALGQHVIVENRTGANGNIAAEAVVRGPADGYTLLFGVDSAITVNPHLYKMSFDPLQDLIPIASLASNQLLLAANKDVPVQSLSELVEFARRASPSLAFSSSGRGSLHHLAMEMLKQRAGIQDMVHVPYKGAVPAVTGTLAGETSLGFSGSANAGLVRTGKLRGIAVSGSKRSPAFPELPTIGETYPGYEVEVWFGLMARTGTPDPIVATLRSSVNALLTRPDFVKRMQSSGSVDVLNLSPEEFASRIQSDFAKYGKIIKDVGITAN